MTTPSIRPMIFGSDLTTGLRIRPVKYRYVMADIRTGKMIAVLPITGVSYSVGIYQGQEMSGTVYLPDMYLDQMGHEPLNRYERWIHFDKGLPLGSMFEVGNVALYVMRNEKVVWGGILWSRSYSSGAKTMTITGLSWDAYIYYRTIRKTVAFPTPTEKYTIWRALLMQILDPTNGDFGWKGDDGLNKNSGNRFAEGGHAYPWTGLKSDTAGGRLPTDYVERWPHNAPPIELPPAGMVSGLPLATIDESWQGFQMDNVGSQLEQFANVNNLVTAGGFEFRVLCWWDANQERFRQRYSFGRMIYNNPDDPDDHSATPTAIRDPLFGQTYPDAEKTIFDFPGHISEWSLAESMENAATRVIVTGGSEEGKIAAYAADVELLQGSGNPAAPAADHGHDGWLLYDAVFNYETSQYTMIQNRADQLLKYSHVPVAAQIDDIENVNSSSTQRASQRSTQLSVSLYVDPTTMFPPWGVGDWVTFSINDPLYGGVMYLKRRIIKYSVTVLPDHESDYSHEQIALELTDDTKVEVGG